MILTLREIQAMDVILKRLLKCNYIETPLKLVVQINNSLWTGDFTNLKSVYIDIERIDYDGDYTYSQVSCNSFVKVLEELQSEKYSKLLKDNHHSLLGEIFNILKSNEITDEDFPPIVFNPVNLETSIALPYLYLDYETKYNVVSIIQR